MTDPERPDERKVAVAVIDATMIADLRSLARRARELAYTGGYENEHALLGLANALSEVVGRLEGA